jgi:TonB family protein
MPKGQIVDVAPGNNVQTETAKYLAETSNTVKKETRAREQTPVYSHATPKNAPNPEANAVAKGAVGGRSAPAVQGVRAIDRLNDTSGFRPRLSEMMREATVGREDMHPESPDRAGLEQGESEQVHSGDAAEAGGGAPNDDLGNVAEGEGTFLNTREFKYAGFFNRVKQAVSARWDPMGRLRAKDPRAAQQGSPDRVTVLNVTLRPDGSIRDIFVAQSSGLDYLDQESIAAFEKAQPFANPPAGLIENGLIHFAFGFKVMNNDAPGAGPNMFRFGG